MDYANDQAHVQYSRRQVFEIQPRRIPSSSQVSSRRSLSRIRDRTTPEPSCRECVCPLYHRDAGRSKDESAKLTTGVRLFLIPSAKPSNKQRTHHQLRPGHHRHYRWAIPRNEEIARDGCKAGMATVHQLTASLPVEPVGSDGWWCS